MVIGANAMKELLRTNNIVVISFVEALLKEQSIDYLVLDENMSVLEGSLGIIPRRILVPDNSLNRARHILEEADLGRELKPAKEYR